MWFDVSRETTGSDLIATVNYHSSFLRPWCQPTWTNTLPRHFRRGPASHKPFDYFSSIIYPFYMFYTAKTFCVHRRVRNHYTKRILNLILNRKKFLRRENETLCFREVCSHENRYFIGRHSLAQDAVGDCRHDLRVLGLYYLHVRLSCQERHEGTMPHKRTVAHLVIKTRDQLEHVSLSGTSPLGYHRGVPLGWCDLRLTQIVSSWWRG